MYIIIPMAGDGTRFKKVGLNQPKHMITVKNKTLFEWSILSLQNFFSEQFIFIVRKSHNAKNFIQKKCLKLGIDNYKIKEIDHLTTGQATTVLKAKNLIKDFAKGILIYNIDTYVEPDQLKPNDIKGQGWIPAFKASGTKWSFVKTDKNNKVNQITEKIRISNYGCIGLYYFKSFNLFEKCYNNYNFNKYKEKFVAPLYGVLLNKNGKVYSKIVNRNKVHVLGTPEDVIKFYPKFKKQ